MTEWDEQSAVKKYNEVLESSQCQRALLETQCGLWTAMAFASDQWLATSPGSMGGTAIKQLRTVVDIGRRDVRLSLNAIRGEIKQHCARTKPRDLEWTVEPATESPRDRGAAQVGQKLLDLHLMPKMALNVLRDMNVWRATLGTCFIRRCMMPMEEGLKLRDEMGEPMKGEDGEQLELPGVYDHWWECGPPYELVRDPSANNWRFDNEEFVGHEKAVPVSKLQAMIPGFRPPDGLKTTMGELLSFQNDVYGIMHGRSGMSAADSKQPALMYCEGFYRGKGWKWTHFLQGWRDSGASEGAGRGVHLINFGPNGYHGLPIHQYVYDWPPGMAWGMGLAEELIPHQRMQNFSVTQLLRLILDAGGKHIINVSALKDKKYEDILGNRLKPFVVTSAEGMKAVGRVPPNATDPNLIFAMAQSQRWIEQGGGAADVLRGVTSKRGESDKAVKTKIGQAEGPIMSMIDEDEGITNDLLTGTLADMGSTATLEEVQTATGGEFGPQEIEAFLSLDFDQATPSVTVARDSLRPKPPEEHLRTMAAAIESTMIEGPAARRAHMIRTGEGLDPLEEAAWREQQAEIRAMRAGHPVEVNFWDDHDTHLWTIKFEKAQPRWRSYPPEVRAAIEQHGGEHWDMKGAQANGPGPGQPGQEQEQGQEQPQEPTAPQGQPGLGQQQVALARVGGGVGRGGPPPQGPGVLPQVAPSGPAAGPGMR